jgi:hypothetical protein
MGYRSDLEVFDNSVATLVDVSSILFAYQIGLHNFGWEVGIFYGFLDAFLVVWMRKPISRLVRSINPFRIKAQEVEETRKDSAGRIDIWPSSIGQIEESYGSGRDLQKSPD